MSIIKFENVHYTYPGDQLESLCGVSLEIQEGSFVAVLGHNGSGKSTLAKHMNALLVPTEGKVTVCGIDSADEERLIQLRRNVGMVFQNPDNQIVANVVEDDVAFAPENLGVEPAEIRRALFPLRHRPVRRPAGRCRSGISDFVLLKSSLPFVFLFLVVRPSERGCTPNLRLFYKLPQPPEAAAPSKREPFGFLPSESLPP